MAERAGLQFEASHLSVFADKVSARVAEAGFESFLDYYYFLRYDAGGAAEMQELVDTLVVGETYLFRELVALETLVDRLAIPAIAEGRPVRIWCAACATGEEPHTLAMLLAARGVLDRVEVVASDISGAALTRARQGRFSRRALRQAELPSFAQPWLRLVDGVPVVRPELTKAIDWRQVNLMATDQVAALGIFDVVLCRNVLIYFSDDTVRQVVDRLSASLRPGGALFVGVSESLLRFGTALACEEQSGVFFYRKVK